MLEQIIKIIRTELSLGETVKITEDTNLREDLEADSLNIVEIVMALEDEFEIEISEDDLDEKEGIKTIGDLEKYIANKMN